MKRTVRAFAILFIAVLIPFSIASAGPKKADWEPVGLSGGGGMFSPAISPVNGNRMLVHCDMSGAYFSEDGGRNWTLIHHAQLTSNTKCRPAFHPQKEEIAYSASGWNGRKVMITADGGRTWSKLADAPGPLRGEIAIDPDAPAFILAGTGEGVSRSWDGGKTWTACAGPAGEILAFAFDRTAGGASARTAFAAASKGIWRTVDSGLHWTLKTNGLPDREILAFSGASRPSGKRRKRKATAVLYASVRCKLTDGKLTGGIYRSVDRGESWRPVPRKGLNNFTTRLDRWAAGDIAQYHWILTTDADPYRVYAFNSNTGVAQPHHATVYRSDNAGESWRATFNPDPRWEPTNVDKYYVVAEDNQFYQGVPYGMVVSDADPDRVMFVTSQMFVTESGGESWFCGFTRLAPGLKKPIGNRRAPGLDWVCNGLVVTTTWNYYFDSFLRDRRYIAYTDIGLAISDDAGRTWKWWSEAGRAPWRNTCYELAFDPAVRGKIWGAFSNVHDIPNDNIISGRHNADGPGGICMSVDHGATWTPLAGGLPVAPCTSIVIDPKSSPKARALYAGFFEKGVYRSTDGGNSWRAMNRGLGHESNMRVTKVFLHRDRTLFASITAKRRGREFLPEGVGLYRSKDGGASWESITRSRGFLWLKDFTVDPADSNVIYLGVCDGRSGGASDGKGGLYRTTDGGKSWRRLAREGSQTFGAYLHPRRKGWIYMTLTEGAPGAGLWLSIDAGKTFHAIEGFPFKNAQRVVFPPRGMTVKGDTSDIYVTTFGASVWHGPEE